MSLLYCIIRGILANTDKVPAKEHVIRTLQDDYAWPLIWSEDVKRYN